MHVDTIELGALNESLCVCTGENYTAQRVRHVNTNQYHVCMYEESLTMSRC